jgi:hypothetical protein
MPVEHSPTGPLNDALDLRSDVSGDFLRFNQQTAPSPSTSRNPSPSLGDPDPGTSSAAVAPDEPPDNPPPDDPLGSLYNSDEDTDNLTLKPARVSARTTAKAKAAQEQQLLADLDKQLKDIDTDDEGSRTNSITAVLAQANANLNGRGPPF